MHQEKYIGMDVHQATISVAVMDSQGKLIMECIARDQGGHDSGVHPRRAWNSSGDLRGRNLRCLVTRSSETTCQPSGSLRPAEKRSVEGWQQE